MVYYSLSCVCIHTCPLHYSLLLQAYAMMLSLSENAPLHTSSQNSLGAWLDMAGAASESGAFNPINHLWEVNKALARVQARRRWCCNYPSKNPSKQKMDERASGSRLDFRLRRKPVASDLQVLRFIYPEFSFLIYQNEPLQNWITLMQP